MALSDLRTLGRPSSGSTRASLGIPEQTHSAANPTDHAQLHDRECCQLSARSQHPARTRTKGAVARDVTAPLVHLPPASESSSRTRTGDGDKSPSSQPSCPHGSRFTNGASLKRKSSDVISDIRGCRTGKPTSRWAHPRRAACRPPKTSGRSKNPKPESPTSTFERISPRRET